MDGSRCRIGPMWLLWKLLFLEILKGKQMGHNKSSKRWGALNHLHVSLVVGMVSLTVGPCLQSSLLAARAVVLKSTSSHDTWYSSRKASQALGHHPPFQEHLPHIVPESAPLLHWPLLKHHLPRDILPDSLI